jgi:Zn-dependent peptidase ImmA (M78 family)
MSIAPVGPRPATLGWSPWAELRRHPDIWVHRCRLTEGLGWWCPGERVILVDERLDRRQTRCVVAHELAHAVLGHEGCHDFADRDWLAQRLESAADRWAALRLVPASALADAVAAHPDDVEMVARQLDVVPDMLLLRLRHLDDRERAVVLSRCGAVDLAA